MTRPSRLRTFGTVLVVALVAILTTIALTVGFALAIPGAIGWAVIRAVRSLSLAARLLVRRARRQKVDATKFTTSPDGHTEPTCDGVACLTCHYLAAADRDDRREPSEFEAATERTWPEEP